MILFLTPYPRDTAGSQRFRFEQYYQLLEEKNISYSIQPFWDAKGWQVLYKKGNAALKFLYLIKGIIRRWSLVIRTSSYDHIFIHREIYPTGTGFLIFVLTKMLKRKVIYDFDDAIWLPNYADNNKKFAFLKSYGQVPALCKIAQKLSVGNNYLKDYALQYNQNVIINPTTLDTDLRHNQLKQKHEGKAIIGWTGTHSTMKYLEFLFPLLDDLINEYEFELLIISDKIADYNKPYIRFVKWSKEKEIEDLLKMSVGVMPLSDDQWTRGKCGFKALQYMSLGIPAIVSPVGVNSEIVDHEINGWVCDDLKEWEVILRQILSDSTMVESRRTAAREKIVSNYSVASNADNFLSLFQ